MSDKTTSSSVTKPTEADSQEQPRRLFTVKRIYAVATWSYDTEYEKCAICQHHLQDDCISCLSAKKTGECPASFGKCDHVFHDHCITKWGEKHDGMCAYNGCGKKFEPKDKVMD